MKVAVVGAGGFVGSSLCERLFFEGEFEFVPVIHGYGGASRLARLPVPLRVADVANEEQLCAALEGCDAIVNCSRGDATVMDRGLRNLIRAARANKIKRLVHISSISIYGSHPPGASKDESAPPCPDDPYGAMKARQDETLMEAHAAGLSVILLCPANIYGPYSAFISGAVDHIRRGLVLLVDGGNNPTNHVHVNNVVEAIIVALRADAGWGERYFVNEVEQITWRQFYEDLGAMLGVEAEFSTISRDEVLRAVAEPPPGRTGLMDNIKIMCSGEFRRGLTVLPVFGTVNGFVYRTFNRVDPRVQEWLRGKMARPTLITKDASGPQVSPKFVGEQLKSIYHSPAKIMRVLGYRPFTYRQGMATVKDWLDFVSNRPDVDTRSI